VTSFNARKTAKVFTAENNELGVIKRGALSSCVSFIHDCSHIPPASNISQLAKLVRAVVKAASLRMQLDDLLQPSFLLPPSANLVANAFMRYNGISVCIICQNGTCHLHAYRRRPSFILACHCTNQEGIRGGIRVSNRHRRSIQIAVVSDH